MNKCTITLVLFLSVLPAHNLMANEPAHLAYLTSWDLPEDANEQLQASKADGYILSFAKWDAQGQISSSDKLLEIPSASASEIPLAYQTWTHLSLQNPQLAMLVSFGGQEFEGIWDLLDSPEQIRRVADSIVQLLNTDFPVYKKMQDDTLKIVGKTRLDGVDFDFEMAKRLSTEQNQQVAKLSKLIRDSVGNDKVIALTTYHVGADPIACRDASVLSGCSFISEDRSTHHGEVLPLLQQTLGLFDFYNVMAYDAGRDFRYQIAMQNYAKAVGSKTKLRLGMSINRQWGPSGGFVMPLAENQYRAKWQQSEGFGGFFIWALGANTELQPLKNQIRQFNSLVESSQN